MDNLAIKDGINYLNYLVKRGNTILILGMHRSGTSCITKMVGMSGAHMGENMIGGNKWNKKGFWEHTWGWKINKNILENSNGSWENPPSSLQVSWRIRIRMRRFIARLHADGRTAVWKDPRNVLTFPMWRPLVSRYFPVIVFRHPMSVARSLERRNNFKIEKGLGLWNEYNKRILDIADQEDEALFVNFDGGVNHIRSRIRQLSKMVKGLQFNTEAVGFYDEDLRTSDNCTQIPIEDVHNTYTELIERSSKL